MCVSVNVSAQKPAASSAFPSIHRLGLIFGAVLAFLLFAADQSEFRALWGGPDDDPVTARHMVRTHVDRAAFLFRGALGVRDGLHPEVIAPVRHLVHGAEQRAGPRSLKVEEAVQAVLAHIHELVAAPAELLSVELPSGIDVAGLQLIPAAAAEAAVG